MKVSGDEWAPKKRVKELSLEAPVARVVQALLPAGDSMKDAAARRATRMPGLHGGEPLSPKKAPVLTAQEEREREMNGSKMSFAMPPVLALRAASGAAGAEAFKPAARRGEIAAG